MHLAMTRMRLTGNQVAVESEGRNDIVPPFLYVFMFKSRLLICSTEFAFTLSFLNFCGGYCYRMTILLPQVSYLWVRCLREVHLPTLHSEGVFPYALV